MYIAGGSVYITNTFFMQPILASTVPVGRERKGDRVIVMIGFTPPCAFAPEIALTAHKIGAVIFILEMGTLRIGKETCPKLQPVSGGVI